MHRLGWLRYLALATLAASILTACTVGVPGGMIGGILSTLLVILLFAFAGGSQTGCDDNRSPSPDPEDMSIGPCLSQLPPDMGLDMAIGPCLGAPQEDMRVLPVDSGVDAALDSQIGPCLSAPQEDMGVGPCLDTIDPDAGPDAEIGPCLSPPPPGDGGMGAVVPRRRPVALDHAAIFARVLPGLPADIAARLGRVPTDSEKS